MKDIQVCINPHFDGVSLWVGTVGSSSLCDMSRGVFAAKRGVPRLLEMFKRYGIVTTWGVTGHAMESFPKAAEMLLKAGHELAVHGYLHENPLELSRQQEADVLDKAIEIITEMSGRRPVGYMAPTWELSGNSVDLLLERGFLYESSLMEDDFHPYFLRNGDSQAAYDKSGPAEGWMKPWTAGTPVDLVEIPASWHLDDFPPTTFIKNAPNSHGWVTGQEFEQIWKDHFDWAYRNNDYAIIPFTVHPDAAGKPHVLMAVERLIEYMLKHSGVRMITFEEMAADFRKRVPFGSGLSVGGESGV